MQILYYNTNRLATLLTFQECILQRCTRVGERMRIPRDRVLLFYLILFLFFFLHLQRLHGCMHKHIRIVCIEEGGEHVRRVPHASSYIFHLCVRAEIKHVRDVSEYKPRM